MRRRRLAISQTTVEGVEVVLTEDRIVDAVVALDVVVEVVDSLCLEPPC